MAKRAAVSSLVLTMVIVGGRFITGSGSGAEVAAVTPPTAPPVAVSTAAVSTAAGTGSPDTARTEVADVPLTNAPSATGYQPATPARLLDTRLGAATADGQGAGTGALAVGATVEVVVAGRGGVAGNATAAALNVTATDAGGNGFLTVWPCGQARPLASSLNYGAGRDVANAVLTRIGAGGRVCIYAGAAPAHVIVDVAGWYPVGAEYVAATPARLLDTRPGAATADGQGAGGGIVAAGGTAELVVTGRGGVPSNPSAVALNVTATGAAGNGFLTVWPCGQARPLASSLNFSAGRDVANAVLATVGDGDRVCVYAGAAATHLVVDVTGWFPGGSSTGGGITGNPPPPVTTPLPPIQPGQWQEVTPPGITLGTGPDDFGMQAMGSSASDPRVIYVGTSYHGIWRTTDAGTTWSKVNTGANGANLETGRNWALAVDPTNSDVLYTAAGYGNGQGLWKSVNGGRDWQQMMSPSLLSQTTADIYSIAIDPTNAAHVLVSFHGPWGGNNSDAGLIESFDGGASWRVIPAGAGWAWGHYVYFVDSNSWILATQNDGHWRTDDSGATWQKITDMDMTHGGGDFYRAANGVMYLAANRTVLRSTDGGYTWAGVIPEVQDGYYTIVSDGTRMYAQSGNTGGNTLNPDPPPYVTDESDGTSWAPLNGGAGPFPENGPFYAVYDPVNRIIVSSNWLAGVWRYKVP